MFLNNLKIALRALQKHKLFALMNIAGLAIGLTIFVFGNLLVEYETSHDAFFAKASRTWTLGSIAAPEANIGVERMNAAFSAVGPLVRESMPDVELVARTIVGEYLVTRGDERNYQYVRFADPEFLKVFDFRYIQGNESALDDASGVLMTESAAKRYFGRSDVTGETLTLDNRYDFHVSAVIEDVPANSHFNSLLIIDEATLEIVLPMRARERMTPEFGISGDWHNLSIGNMTYVVLPDGLDGAWLQAQMDALYERAMPREQRELMSGFWVLPLTRANLSIWDTISMPVVEVVQLLSLLVLLVACVNYTNLATAQSLGRSREVGMRKTMGASQAQLLAQFLVESILTAALAMVAAIALLEVIIPLFDNASGKVLRLDYMATLPWLVLTVLGVGIGAGLYPAWLITRAHPIEALRDTARKGRKGARVRAVMIGVQFAISAFMLSLVAIVYFQNQKVESESRVFPRSEIYTLQRLNTDEIRPRLDTLRHELEKLPEVESVAYSTQVPYEQSNNTGSVARRQGDEAGKFSMHQMRVSPEFFATYDIPLVAGRIFSRDMAGDRMADKDARSVNVVINELAVQKLGFASADEALGERFYSISSDDKSREYLVIGVVPTQNIVGLFNSLKPWMFQYDDRMYTASVRIRGGATMQVVNRIEDTWKRVIPEYPMQGRFLDAVFDDVYNILKFMNATLAGFAIVALVLAMIGLFGLAAFMATQRTKEIGVRKVLGASSLQIARLLVWQFSRPVIWALGLALPLAFLASNVYLNFFAERIATVIPILLLAGLVAVLLAWTAVAGHALRIARANPIHALRYE